MILKVLNVVFFFIKLFGVKEKGINIVYLFYFKVICFLRNIGFKFIVKFIVISGIMYIL